MVAPPTLLLAPANYAEHHVIYYNRNNVGLHFLRVNLAACSKLGQDKDEFQWEPGGDKVQRPNRGILPADVKEGLPGVLNIHASFQGKFDEV